MQDLEKVFQVLRLYDIKLNPTTCVFGIRLGRFLGYMVIVLDVEAPKGIKDIQKLIRRIMALSRFIYRSTEKSFLFFKILKSCRLNRMTNITELLSN